MRCLLILATMLYSASASAADIVYISVAESTSLGDVAAMDDAVVLAISRFEQHSLIIFS